MFGRDQWILCEVVKRREDGDQVRGEVADSGKGMRGNPARVDMSRMGGDDGDDVPL